MDRQALVAMLNKDLADEHASVIRYLIHAYQVGEDTGLGAMLLATAREEMWHMDWLADELGEMGVEPEMRQGNYPHDPTSNASLLRSYIEWERNLVQEYAAQAEQVDDPGLQNILMQQSQESGAHQQRFESWLNRLGEAGEQPLAWEDSGAFSSRMIGRLQSEMADEYTLVLQHLRHAFVLAEESCPVSSELELTAMRHMKHLSYFAERLAESGHELTFEHPEIDASCEVEGALEADLALTEAARARFLELSQNAELVDHQGLKRDVEHAASQEAFLVASVGGLLQSAQAPGPEPEPEVEVEPAPPAQPEVAAEPAPPAQPEVAAEPAPPVLPQVAPKPEMPAKSLLGKFTVGSLIRDEEDGHE